MDTVDSCSSLDICLDSFLLNSAMFVFSDPLHHPPPLELALHVPHNLLRLDKGASQSDNADKHVPCSKGFKISCTPFQFRKKYKLLYKNPTLYHTPQLLTQ